MSTADLFAELFEGQQAAFAAVLGNVTNWERQIITPEMLFYSGSLGEALPHTFITIGQWKYTAGAYNMGVIVREGKLCRLTDEQVGRLLKEAEEQLGPETAPMSTHRSSI